MKAKLFSTQSLALIIIVIAIIGIIAIQFQKADEIRRTLLTNISTEVRHHNADVKNIIQKQLNLTLIEETNHLLHDVMNLLGNRTATVSPNDESVGQLASR